MSAHTKTSSSVSKPARGYQLSVIKNLDPARLPPFTVLVHYLNDGHVPRRACRRGKKVSTRSAKDIKSTDLLYADDTLFIGSRAQPRNLLIATIAKHSERYGIKLNAAKCEYLRVNIKKHKKDVKIMYPDETLKKRVGKATYLGGNIYDNGSSKGEVENRINRTAIVLGKLRPFWSSDSSTKWKINGS